MRTRRVVAGVLLIAAVLGGCKGNGVVSRSDDPPSDVEKLRPVAAQLTDAWVKKDWPAVRARFDTTMRNGLSEEGLADGSKQIEAQVGAFKSRGEPIQVPKPGGFVVFDTPMRFERGDLKSRFSFRPNGDVAGFYILLPDVP